MEIFSFVIRYGVTLIGVRREPKESQIFLNPGPNFKLAYDDALFYIAITSEEDMALEELTKQSQNTKRTPSFLKKGDGKKSRKLTRQSEWGSFISVIDNSEEEKNIDQSGLAFFLEYYKCLQTIAIS